MTLWDSLPQDTVEAEGLSRFEEGPGKFQEDQLIHGH